MVRLGTRSGFQKSHRCRALIVVWGLQGQRPLADAILVLPPYYLAGVSQAGIAAFLRPILQASQLPVFLYNFPANTNSLISPQLYAELAAEFPVLRGVKNTFEDIPLAKQFKDAAPHLQVESSCCWHILMPETRHQQHQAAVRGAMNYISLTHLCTWSCYPGRHCREGSAGQAGAEAASFWLALLPCSAGLHNGTGR